jgi:hypothetical protein
MHRQLDDMKRELRDLYERKQDELTIELRDRDQRELEMKSEIDTLKVRKSAYERLLQDLKADPGLDPMGTAPVRDELAALKAKEAFVTKWIEQLQDDARASTSRPRC